MKKINVTIEGLSPLLMANPENILLHKEISVQQKFDPVKAAENLAYRKEDKELYIPERAIFRCILNGASFRKVGKFSAKSVLAGNVKITPEKIGLGTQKYEIDITTAVNQVGKKRNRVLVARPKLATWKASFQILINDEYIQDEAIIRLCLEDAGVRIGILSFRPQLLGSFGMFKVTKFEVVG